MHAMTQAHTSLARGGAALALAAGLSLGGFHQAHAEGAGQASTAQTRGLTLQDFFNVYPDEVEDVSGTAKATVAGITYAHAIELDRGIAALSYNVHRYPGDTAPSLLVGLTDAGDAGSQDTLLVSADGRLVKMITAHPGSPAVPVVIPFAGITVIHFSVRGDDPASSGLLIADPTLLR